MNLFLIYDKHLSNEYKNEHFFTNLLEISNQNACL